MSGGDQENERYMVEFVSMGNSVKVTVIDPVSMREVSMIGSTKASRRQLTELAVRKMEYVLNKEKGES